MLSDLDAAGVLSTAVGPIHDRGSELKDALCNGAQGVDDNCVRRSRCTLCSSIKTSMVAIVFPAFQLLPP